jgi:hypothetical protein
MKRNKSKQVNPGGFFSDGQDTPLLSGSPIRADDQAFAPKENAAQQGQLFAFDLEHTRRAKHQGQEDDAAGLPLFSQ